jgi:uncharacterized membrane protein (DUF4010 family)
VERERRKKQGGHSATAGLRTFTIAALAGALAQGLGQTWLVALGGLLVVALVVIGYWRDRSADQGITTELALFATYVLGVSAMAYPQLTGAVAVVVAALLAARSDLHRLSTELITTQELHSALILASAALVVLPLVPDQPWPWLAQVNPRDLWRLTVILMGLQMAGHIGLRVAGPRLGMAFSGLASGFVSSTATIAAMGVKARQTPALMQPCITAAMASNLATLLLMGIIASAIDAKLLPHIAPPLVGAAIPVLMMLTAALHKRSPAADLPPSAIPAHVFKLTQTLAFAALLTLVTTVIAWLSRHAPPQAQSLGVAMAGLADVHAASAAVFGLSAHGQLPASGVVVPMLLAMSANSLSKAVGAVASGGLRYGLSVISGLVAMMGCAWLGWWFMGAN